MTSAVNAVAVGRDDGQAAAVDGDRVAVAASSSDGGRARRSAGRVAEVVEGGDGAELLDDAGEHRRSSFVGASG